MAEGHKANAFDIDCLQDVRQYKNFSWWLWVIFELFIFLTLIIVGLISIGIITKHPAIIGLAAVFCILVGAGITTEGIRDEGAFTLVRDGNSFFMSDFNSFTTTNDFTMMMIAPLYFYGGFIVLLIALFAILWGVKQRREDIL